MVSFNVFNALYLVVNYLKSQIHNVFLHMYHLFTNDTIFKKKMMINKLIFLTQVLFISVII